MWYVSYNYELSGVRETYSSGKKKNSVLSSNKGILQRVIQIILTLLCFCNN